MIIQRVAKAFNLPVQRAPDPYSNEPDVTVCTTSETLQYDLRADERSVSVYSRCAPTAKTTNGVLCAMHASEV